METLQLAWADGVVTVLDGPATNAVNDVMWCEPLSVDEAADLADDRVVIVTGAEGNFCSGADLAVARQMRHQPRGCARSARPARRCTACPSR